MFYVFASIVLLVVVFLVYTVIAEHFTAKRSDTAKALDNERAARVGSDRALGKAERALRAVANGAGNPVLEAQIALDEITAYREQSYAPDSKELN